jgi:hypothetical protein
VRPALVLAPLLVGVGPLVACADDPPPAAVPPPPVAAFIRTDEGHLSGLRKLTARGANGAPRWSWAGDQLVFQTRAVDAAGACPRVTRLSLRALGDPSALASIVDGEAPAFLPGDHDVVYAAAPSCGPAAASPAPFAPFAPLARLDPALDLFRTRADGSTTPTRLTATPGYDGEAATCGKTGAVVFTSMRDGDPDLYRMDADGGQVVRLTATAGYDGGAAFDADCTHIVWQAWHPKGQELEVYKKQLADNALRPPTLELWMANADGTDARQVTSLDALSWAPTFYPSESRVLFASGFGGASARDVDLWAIDLDGTNLERVTTAPGFDGAPAFSPDGKSLAFASERATPLGRSDTHVLVARWSGAWRHVEERPADHLMGDAAWLAYRTREGRGLGSKGLDEAGAYVERSFRSFGLAPGGDEERASDRPTTSESFRQGFDVATQVSGQATLLVAGIPVAGSEVRALGFSASKAVDGPLVFVGAEGDYARLDVKGKIVVVRGGTSPRHAAFLARQHGAVGFVAVTEEAPRDPSPESSEELPAAIASSAAMAPVLGRLVHGQQPAAHLAVTLAPETARAFNVVARWRASAPEGQRLSGVVVVGAHYDGVGAASPGADSNASGTAALLQVARALGESKPTLRRDIVLVAFSGEAQGAAGARAFVKKPPGGLSAKDLIALVDLDMVGRMRENTLQVFGADSAAEWTDLLAGACDTARVDCVQATGGGLGGADRLPFFEAHVPAVQLFTGVHGDYGKGTDTADRLNATGMAQVARIAEHLAGDVSDLGGRLDFLSGAATPGEGDSRGFGASLGTIPDRAGPPNGQKGMLLAGVRPHGPADAAGLRRGDILVRLGGHVVGTMDDVKFVMTQSKPGARMKAVVLRDGKEVAVEVTLDAPSKR